MHLYVWAGWCAGFSALRKQFRWCRNFKENRDCTLSSSPCGPGKQGWRICRTFLSGKSDIRPPGYRKESPFLLPSHDDSCLCWMNSTFPFPFPAHKSWESERVWILSFLSQVKHYFPGWNEKISAICFRIIRVWEVGGRGGSGQRRQHTTDHESSDCWRWCWVHGSSLDDSTFLFSISLHLFLNKKRLHTHTHTPHSWGSEKH